MGKFGMIYKNRYLFYAMMHLIVRGMEVQGNEYYMRHN